MRIIKERILLTNCVGATQSQTNAEQFVQERQRNGIKEDKAKKKIKKDMKTMKMVSTGLAIERYVPPETSIYSVFICKKKFKPNVLYNYNRNNRWNIQGNTQRHVRTYIHTQ